MLIKQLLLLFLFTLCLSLLLCLPTPFHSLISVIMSEWQVLHASTHCKTELEDRTLRVNIRHPVQQAWGSCLWKCVYMLACISSPWDQQGWMLQCHEIHAESSLAGEGLYRSLGNLGSRSGMCSGNERKETWDQIKAPTHFFLPFHLAPTPEEPGRPWLHSFHHVSLFVSTTRCGNDPACCLSPIPVSVYLKGWDIVLPLSPKENSNAAGVASFWYKGIHYLLS